MNAPSSRPRLFLGLGVHYILDFISEPVEMLVQPVKHVALRLVGCAVADQRGFGSFLPKHFDRRLVVLHDVGCLGGWSPGDASHSLTWEPVSAWRARRRS